MTSLSGSFLCVFLPVTYTNNTTNANNIKDLSFSQSRENLGDLHTIRSPSTTVPSYHRPLHVAVLHLHVQGDRYQTCLPNKTYMKSRNHDWSFDTPRYGSQKDNTFSHMLISVFLNTMQLLLLFWSYPFIDFLLVSSTPSSPS